MGRKPRKSLKKYLKIEPSSAIKSSISKLKPTLVALVFLLLSGYVQQLVQTGNVNPCNAQNIGLSIFATTHSFKNQSLEVGQRTLIITAHAAQRMLQREVTTQNIQSVIRMGQIFAYRHSQLIKIGYYDEATKLFLAVDQRHKQVITVIGNVPKIYIERLIGR